MQKASASDRWQNAFLPSERGRKESDADAHKRKHPLLFRRKADACWIFHFFLSSILNGAFFIQVSPLGVDGNDQRQILHLQLTDGFRSQVFKGDYARLPDASGNQRSCAAVAAKYTPPLRRIASRTGWLLGPLPIMPMSPLSHSMGAYASIR